MIRLVVDTHARLQASELPTGLLREIRKRLSFPNPQWIENDKRGFSNWNTPRDLCFLQDLGEELVFPRGATRSILGLVRSAGYQVQIDDRRRTMPEVSFSFAGQLRDYQIEAVDAMASRDFGTLQAPTGSGKTTMALSLIARRKQPALIVVHTRELMHQWVERIGQFLCIPANEVGLIGDGKKRIGDRITVGLVQSLLKCASEVAPHIGHLVMDECHKAPSKTFLDVVTAFDCRFMTGLSATPYRRDGLGRLIWWFIGDKVHEVPAQELQDNGSILKAEVIWRETAFSTMLDPSTQYSRMLSELCTDPQRNQLICSDVAEEIREASGVCLILSDRKSHCRDLQAMLGRMGINAALLIGDMKAKERHQVVEDLNEGRCKVVVATGQLIGEGFDCKALSTLFLACPVKFSGRMIQYLGRVLRPAPGKDRARVLDYVDPIGVLQNAARARQRVYDGAT